MIKNVLSYVELTANWRWKLYVLYAPGLGFRFFSNCFVRLRILPIDSCFQGCVDNRLTFVVFLVTNSFLLNPSCPVPQRIDFEMSKCLSSINLTAICLNRKRMSNKIERNYFLLLFLFLHTACYCSCPLRQVEDFPCFLFVLAMFIHVILSKLFYSKYAHKSLF